MSISHELEREFREISGTKFWKKFIDVLNEDRRLLSRQLERSEAISRPCNRGEIWQGQIQTIDRLMKLPYQIIGYDSENPEGTE